MKRIILSLPLLFFVLIHCSSNSSTQEQLHPTPDNGQWFFLKSEDIAQQKHNITHSQRLARHVTGYNRFILQGIDRVQSLAPDGGGYFIGIKAQPPESPTGYRLTLLSAPLLEPPRPTSYCSGATYSAFVEALNLILPLLRPQQSIPAPQLEALRMQEPDGGRREDHIKFWGKWNADGFGNYFALVRYARMGKRVKPVQARPGDFMNISWKKGGGHSVIFLGWFIDKQNKPYVYYWSSQKRTNGYGDDLVPIDRIQEVMIVRLTNPERVFTFDTTSIPDTAPKGDVIKLP